MTKFSWTVTAVRDGKVIGRRKCKFPAMPQRIGQCARWMISCGFKCWFDAETVYVKTKLEGKPMIWVVTLDR